ncbi:hypothetical protein ABZ682_18775 [Streptomyces griseoviridis]|uniref:hypothetical protein n=1 Tax=Streptomyces griseoviridis TaxID=45398 RepID=UPI0033E8EC92
MNPRDITIFDLFHARTGPGPGEFPVGAFFEVLSLPEGQARRMVSTLAHHAPHPIGAAIACDDRWTLLLPPGSHEERWPPEADYRRTGWVAVPPVFAVPSGSPRWARRGNETGRAFTAPLLLSMTLAASNTRNQNDSGLASVPFRVPTPELV